jgi:hypothetical protein
VALFVEVPIVGALYAAARHGRDHRGFSSGEERRDHSLVGVISLVGQESVGLELRQEGIGSLQIVGLTWRQQEPQRVAQGIDESVNFCAQSASAEPDGFVVLGLFLRAPALCWWARTMVESIIAYSLSASTAKALNSLSHTPLSAQRVCRV